MKVALSDDRQYRLLVHAVTDCAIYMLDTDGVVRSWNAGAQRFKGYGAPEIIGQHFSCFYVDEDKEAGLPRLAPNVAASKGMFEAEGWRVRKDGSRFWAHVVIDPVLDEAGALVGFAKVTRDTTARREAETSLEQARAALFQSQEAALAQARAARPSNAGALALIAADQEGLAADAAEALGVARKGSVESAAARAHALKALSHAEYQALSNALVERAEALGGLLLDVVSKLGAVSKRTSARPPWVASAPLLQALTILAAQRPDLATAGMPGSKYPAFRRVG